MPKPPIPTIRSFRDAIGFALELADHYAFAATASLLGPDGRPIDLAVAEGIGCSIEPVVAWAAGIDGWRAAPTKVLLISVRPFDPEVIREVDLRRYRQARWSLARAGCHLADWIETDGDLVRSYAYVTCPAEAWAGDPPDHRLVDGGSPGPADHGSGRSRAGTRAAAPERHEPPRSAASMFPTTRRVRRGRAQIS